MFSVSSFHPSSSPSSSSSIQCNRRHFHQWEDNLDENQEYIDNDHHQSRDRSRNHRHSQPHFFLPLLPLIFMVLLLSPLSTPYFPILMMVTIAEAFVIVPLPPLSPHSPLLLLAPLSSLKGRSLKNSIRKKMKTSNDNNKITTLSSTKKNDINDNNNNNETTVNDDNTISDNSPTSKVAIIGGGWAGFAVAETLSHYLSSSNNNKLSSSSNSNNVNLELTMIDASPSRGGLSSGWKTPLTNRTVEAGIHGFWRGYRNVYDLMECIEGVEIDNVLGEYSPSVLVGKNGRVALAPVLGSDDNVDVEKDKNDVSLPFPFPSPSSLPFIIPNLQIILSLINNVSQITPNSRNKKALLSLQRQLRPLLLPILPPPLDVAFLSEFEDGDSTLTLYDRISGLQLVRHWIDFNPTESNSWKKYDSISAEELFLHGGGSEFSSKSSISTTIGGGGVSQNLYDEVIQPLLHVLPMRPGNECSAASALSCFHCFALNERGAFDVRWPKGTLSQIIFNPWMKQLMKRGLRIKSGTRLESICSKGGEDKGRVDGHGRIKLQLSTKVKREEDGTAITTMQRYVDTYDAVVLCVGAMAASNIVKSSSLLQSFEKVPEGLYNGNMQGITCVSVRIFLEPTITTTSTLLSEEKDNDEKLLELSSSLLPRSLANAMKDSPVLVCGPGMGDIPELYRTGFCIYDLGRMHDEFRSNDNDVAVLEIDFYDAEAVADLKDDADVVDLALRAAAAVVEVATGPIVPILSDDYDGNDDGNKEGDDITNRRPWYLGGLRRQIIDSAVCRSRNAVSSFDVGSASNRCPNGVVWHQAKYSGIDDNTFSGGVYAAGDWIDRAGNGNHHSWSSEKAAATGIQAGRKVASDLGLVRRTRRTSTRGGKNIIRWNDRPIPAPGDGPLLAALRFAADATKGVIWVMP